MIWLLLGSALASEPINPECIERHCGTPKGMTEPTVAHELMTWVWSTLGEWLPITGHHEVSDGRPGSPTR